MALTRYWFRLRFRSRFGGFLVLMLLVAGFGGLGLGSIAAARRTQSAFPAYLASSRASDLVVQPYDLGGPEQNAFSPRLGSELARLPEVERVTASTNVLVATMRADGTPNLVDNRVAEVGSVDGAYFNDDRAIVTQGRLADPRRYDEFVANADAARQLGIRVGQTVTLGSFRVDQPTAPGFGTAAVPPVARFRARLVGTVAFGNQIAHDDVDRYPTTVLFTPALTRTLIREGAAWVPSYALRLRHGARDVPAVERAIARRLPGNEVYNFHTTAVVEAQVERAVKPESIALAVFGIITLLAALAIAGQAIGRQLRTERNDIQVLRTLGGSLRSTVGNAVSGILVAVLVGSMLAGVVAIVLSPLAPLGAVRQVHPSPGYAVDWTVLGVGTVMLCAVLAGVAFVLAWRHSPYRVARVGERVGRRSKVGGLSARAGLPVTAVTGIRFVFEPDRHRAAVPVRSALLGATLAVTVVVATLTFGASLATLVSHPTLYGWNWTAEIREVSGANIPPPLRAALDGSRLVAAWSGYDFANVQIDGQTVPALLSDPHPRLSPPILSGHPVEATDQITVGAATLAQLHKRVGDVVTLTYGAPKDAPVYVPPTRLRIVGTTVLPAIGSSDAVHPSLGTGAVVPRAVEPPAFRAATLNPDSLFNGPAVALVRLRSDVPPARGHAFLQRQADTATTLVNASPAGNGDRFIVMSAQRPAEIVTYQSAGSTATLLAVWLSTGAAVALALTLAASVRQRRRDLALLKTLGFTRRQLAATVSWQASVAALGGIVVGVPLGAGLGRWLWDQFALDISAVPRPTVPMGAILAVVVAAIVVANVAAAIPARLARQVRPATILATE